MNTKNNKSKNNKYDHRLRNMVRETGDIKIALEMGVPRSTASSWLTAPACEVVSNEIFDLTDLQVRARILKLECKVKILTAIIILLLTLVRISRIQLVSNRLADGENKKKLLRAIERAGKTLALCAILKIIGLSSSRYHSWKRSKQNGCQLDDNSSCPKTNTKQLLPEEVKKMHDMATSPDFRHVPTGTLSRVH